MTVASLFTAARDLIVFLAALINCHTAFGPLGLDAIGTVYIISRLFDEGFFEFVAGLQDA